MLHTPCTGIPKEQQGHAALTFIRSYLSSTSCNQEINWRALKRSLTDLFSSPCTGNSTKGNYTLKRINKINTLSDRCKPLHSPPHTQTHHTPGRKKSGGSEVVRSAPAGRNNGLCSSVLLSRHVARGFSLSGGCYAHKPPPCLPHMELELRICSY